MIELDEEEYQTKANGGNRSPSQDSPRVARRPNARMGVKRGPYRVRPKQRVADSFPNGNRYDKRDDADGGRAAGRANGGVLGKRNNNRK